MASVVLRLLGPLELLADGRLVDLGGPRQRVVLAVLALNANRVTSVEQLIDAVWDASPPSTARSQIHVAISALRKLFSSAGCTDAIKTRPPGYMLCIGDESLDHKQFLSQVADAQAQIDAGRSAQAASALRAAIAMWRGPALSDILSDLVRCDAVLLDEQRFAAVETRLRVELALGRHREVIGELQALAGEQPLREGVYELLMLALYRSGRQAEALEVCRRARAMLIEELGIEPGTELQKLERAILNRDPALDLPVPDGGSVSQDGAITGDRSSATYRVTPRLLPAGIADFTGRESQIALITRLFSSEGVAAAAYAVPIVAISGMGGVGKSVLAVRVAHELGDMFPGGHLYADLGSPGGGDPAEVLLRFLRAFGVSGQAVPERLQERIELYRSRLAGQRVLVVLDGVRSEQQVLPLLPGSPACGVITTSRARLTGLPGARQIDLGVFDTAVSLELLGKVVGHDRIAAEQGAAREIANLCGGLPLALRITGARLASKPHWRIKDLGHRLSDEARRLDELTHQSLGVRSNITMTYHALNERAQRLLRLFALIEVPDFPKWTAAALLDTGLTEAEDVLENLVDAQLVDAVAYPDRQLVRYRLHDLIRVYAREQLDGSETDASRHGATARLLGAWLALAEKAHLKEYGGDYGILHGSAARWCPPGDEVVDLIGNPMNWWETERTALTAAVRLAAAEQMHELCWDLALALADPFAARGYFGAWRDTSQAARDASERAGNRAGRAAMLYSLGTLHAFQRRLPDAELCFASARDLFEAQGNEHGRALVIRNWALVDRMQGRYAAMFAKYTEALEMMRAVGDRISQAHILCNLAKYRINRTETDAAAEMLADALAICQELRCLRVEAQVLYRFAELHQVTKDLESARQVLHRVLRIVRDAGDRTGEAYALHSLGVIRCREGHLEQAETTLLSALAVAGRVGERLVEGQTLEMLGRLALAKHDKKAADRYLDKARQIFDEFGYAFCICKEPALTNYTEADRVVAAGNQGGRPVGGLSTCSGSAVIRNVTPVTPGWSESG